MHRPVDLSALAVHLACPGGAPQPADDPRVFDNRQARCIFSRKSAVLNRLTIMGTRNRNTLVTRDQQMIAGIQKHKGTVDSWLISGQTYTAQQVADVLQERVDAEAAIAPARAAYARTVQDARTKRASTKKFVTSVRQAAYLMFESQVDTLDDFGLVPHKTRTEPTAVEKVQAVELRKATRAVRHTMGKKQKAGLKGSATVTVTVTPAPAPPGPVTAAPRPPE